MSKDFWNPFEEEETSPIDEIAKKEKEKKEEQEQQGKEQREQDIKALTESLSNAVKPLQEAVNKTNELITKTNSNSREVNKAVEVLRKALVTKSGENIADFISRQLEVHQQAMARSGIDKITESWERQYKAMEEMTDKMDDFFGSLERVVEASSDKLDRSAKDQSKQVEKFRQTAEYLHSLLEKPKEAKLNWEDRNALDRVGVNVSKAIIRQKWWWVSWGATMILGVAIAVWGVKNLITAGKKEDRAEMIYQNHKYAWSFWYFAQEEWGKRNPKSYSSLLSQFKKKYPELIEQYEKELSEVEEDKKAKEGENGSNLP